MLDVNQVSWVLTTSSAIDCQHTSLLTPFFHDFSNEDAHYSIQVKVKFINFKLYLSKRIKTIVIG